MQRQGDPLSLLARQANWISELQVQKVWYKSNWRSSGSESMVQMQLKKLLEIYLWPPHTCT